MLESFLEVLKVLEVAHAQSAFKSSLNHNSPESRSLPILWSSLMTGACHLLRPASVFIDDRLLAQEDCSFDCRCKDTKIRSRKQAFSRRMLKICCKWLICSDMSICVFYIWLQESPWIAFDDWKAEEGNRVISGQGHFGSFSFSGRKSHI